LGIALCIGIGLAVGTVFLRGPRSPHNHDSEDFVSVALISMESDAHVKELLAGSQIPAVTWGGGKTGYWVQVPECQVLRAMTVLRKNAKDLHYYIHFGDQHPLSHEEKWIEPWIDAPYPDLLSRAQYSSSTQVGVCLRHPEVAGIAKTYSKISRIHYFRHKLFDGAKDTSLVEELWIEKFPELYGGKRRISCFQILNGGGEVHCVVDKESTKD